MPKLPPPPPHTHIGTDITKKVRIPIAQQFYCEGVHDMGHIFKDYTSRHYLMLHFKSETKLGTFRQRGERESILMHCNISHYRQFVL